LIKNSQPFGGKCQKTAGGDFFGLTLYTVRRVYSIADWHRALHARVAFKSDHYHSTFRCPRRLP